VPYIVSFDLSDRIVTVKVSGILSHDDHLKVRNEALRLCQEEHCSKILVDLSELITTSSSVANCFNFGKTFAMTSSNISVAHILPKDAKSKEDVRFVSTVGANRGLIIKDFGTINEARKWLVEKT
jgi:hypothetical protein